MLGTTVFRSIAKTVFENHCVSAVRGRLQLHQERQGIVEEQEATSAAPGSGHSSAPQRLGQTASLRLHGAASGHSSQDRCLAQRCVSLLPEIQQHEFQVDDWARIKARLVVASGDEFNGARSRPFLAGAWLAIKQG